MSDFIFGGSKITADGDCSHEIKRCLLLGRKAMTNLESILKRHHFADKRSYSQSYGFFNSHVWTWELDHKKGWVAKNWSLLIVVLEKTLESPLDSKELQPVNPKGNQSWIFIARSDAEAETSNTLATWCEELTHWERLWCWERLKAGEGDDGGWDGWMHHRLDGCEYERALGDGDGQGSLACCSPWGLKESDTTKRLNWTELKSNGSMMLGWKPCTQRDQEAQLSER